MDHIGQSTLSSPAGALVLASELENGSGPSLSAKAESLKIKFNKDDIIIAVMGATGTGKSTFINLISGSELGVGIGLKSCTSDVGETAFTFKGRRVVLFDTPGFDDTTKSDTDILELVAEFLKTTYEKHAILAGVIYMHRINDVRMGGIAMRNFSMFRKLCGDKSLKNVAIVTNFWSEVTPAQGAAREAELRNEDIFFKPALDKQAKLLRHDGTLTGAGKIIAEIMNNHPMALNIQVELVDEKKSLLETAAGTVLNHDLAEQARKHEEALRKIKEEMNQAIKEHDEESRKELQTAAKELEAKIQDVQMDRLKLEATHSVEMKALKEQLEAKNVTDTVRDALQKQVADLLKQADQQRNRGIWDRMWNT